VTSIEIRHDLQLRDEMVSITLPLSSITGYLHAEARSHTRIASDTDNIILTRYRSTEGNVLVDRVLFTVCPISLRIPRMAIRIRELLGTNAYFLTVQINSLPHLTAAYASLPALFRIVHRQ
jgi:hypothetical protein